MRKVLLRPFWAPPTLHGKWPILLLVVLLVSSLLAGFWPHFVGSEANLTTADTVWWMLMLPIMLCASTMITEAILMQIIATSIMGTLIALLLMFAPAGAKLGSSDPSTLAYWLPSILFFIGVLWSLWLLACCGLYNPRQNGGAC